MVFNSFQFLWLFPLIFAVYYAVVRFAGTWHHGRAANLLLVIISYGVYAQWGLGYAAVMLGVTVVTYVSARLIERHNAYGSKRYLVVTGAVLALLPLLVLKYSGLLVDLAGIVYAPARSVEVSLVAPMGISFFSFQALGYLFDVYRRRIEAEHDWWDYMLFVSFFPQILCGPISRAENLLPQIKAKRKFCYPAAVEGLKMLLWGMFIKVVMADRLALYVDLVLGNYTVCSGTSCLMAMVMFTFQIYGDFAGYSLMACGVGRLLGFDLVNNFRNPYLAVSVTDFWRRWHISLSTWLRDYVYIPLGGSRCGRWRNRLNIIITFAVCGVWHGARLSYIVWGLLHGLLQVVEKFFGLGRRESRNVAVKVIRMVVTFVVINVTMLVFRMPTVADAWRCIVQIFTDHGPLLLVNARTTMVYCVASIAVVVAHDILTEYRPGSRVLMCSRNVVVRWGVYATLTVSIVMAGVLGSGDFIYLRF